MLKNPNFEQDWSDEKSHKCLRCIPGSSPEQTERGNIFTPPGSWLTWFNHSSTFAQPEVKDAWKTGDALRVHSGEKAIQLFTFFKCHDAGFLQQVNVPEGSTVRFSAFAQAWSNHKDKYKPNDFPHPDDPRWSEGVGYGHTLLYDEDIPALNSNPQNDATGNIRFCLGIDPTGEIDPNADTVVWGEGTYSYNGYSPVMVVRTKAKADTITVFLRSTTLWAFKHNDVFWDSAVLEIIEQPAPEPTPPPLETIRGEPRVQYERTYVLMPPGADKTMVLNVLDASWNLERWTVGGSADDAGIGDLDVKRIIAIKPNTWGDNLEAFFEEHYPGVVYWPLDYVNDYQLAGRLLAYSLKESGFSLAYPTTHLPARITDEFGVWRKDYNHNGLDLRSSWHVWKDKALSATTGMVVKAGYDTTEPWFGYQVKVESYTPDKRKVQIRYAHLVASSTEVDIGDRIQPGTVLGKPNSTGVSTADHLHIDVKVGDVYVDPALLMDWPNPDVPPEPLPSFTLRGVHDKAGADWLKDKGLTGWCTIPVYLGTSPQVIESLKAYAEAGIRVLLNLRYSYAVDDGGQGTMPRPEKLAAFEQACIEMIRQNPAAWAFIYGNEFNNDREHPAGFSLTPDYYRDSYNHMWAGKPAGARLLVGAIDPYNPGWGDWRVTWKRVLSEITDCDGLALHAYTHDSDLNRIRSTMQFSDAPLVGVYYDLRVLESQQAIIPERFKNKPQLVTETNHWQRKDGRIGWDADAGQWVAEAYRYFAERGVCGVTPFRFNHNDWRFSDLPDVLRTLEELT